MNILNIYELFFSFQTCFQINTDQIVTFFLVVEQPSELGVVVVVPLVEIGVPSWNPISSMQQSELLLLFDMGACCWAGPVHIAFERHQP